jgi:amino acid transporter
MCLTGVDYFSTLGYQPGIAFLAAQALSPIATLILVLLTLFGALPIYNRVAEESPHGEGSISMLEHLLSRWKGKLFVLVLLGFVATDFVITITLSAADATAHIIENPFTPPLLKHQVGVTLALIAFLGVIFLRGFKEAIGIAVALVAAYLFLNVIVIAVGWYELVTHPFHFPEWKQAVFGHPEVRGQTWRIIFVSLLLFPKLALGLSGFETGVAVMPLVKGDDDISEDDWANIQSTRTAHIDDKKTRRLLRGRIRNAKKLLRTAALIMSVMLISSSFVTSILIPPEKFAEGGEANGRAIAYLAHTYLGNIFGTVYDLSTILILWFAGASARVGQSGASAGYRDYCDRVCCYAHLQCRRGRTRWCLCDRRSGVDDLSCDCCDSRRAQKRKELVSLSSDRFGFRLHHYSKHSRKAGRHQDRFVLHSDDYSRFTVFAGLAFHRAARRAN